MRHPELVVTIIVVAVALGGFTQTVTGFGFALVVAPACAIALPATMVAGTVARLAVAVDATVVLGNREHVEHKAVAHMAWPGLVALPFAIGISRVLSATTVTLVATIVTLGAVGAVASNVASRANGRGRGATAHSIAGFLSGVLGLTTGMSGPPVALHAMCTGRSAAANRGTLATFFLLVDALAVLLHPSAVGLPTMTVCMIAAAAGTAFGTWARSRVAEASVRSAVLWLVAGAALVAAVTTLR